MTFADAEHLRLLAPNTYHPNHLKAIEIHDPFRASSAFASKAANHVIDKPTDNPLGPNEYFADINQLNSVKIHEPKHQNHAFKSKSHRFKTKIASNTNTEAKEWITMEDLRHWAKTTRTIAPKDRVDTAVAAKLIGSKESRTDGADKVYDTEPDLSTRIKRMPLKMQYSHSNPVARFPDNITKSRYFKESNPMGPGSYKIKRKGVTVKDRHKNSSQFKSTTPRFQTKREPLVNYAGWNYNHKTFQKKYWSGGGHFDVGHGLKRFS